MLIADPPLCPIYLALMAALRVVVLGGCLCALRRPTAYTVYLSVFRCIGNSLVWLKRSDLIVSSGSYSTPSTYSFSTTSFTRLFSLLASRIKGYNFHHFTSWGNCSFTHILLPFSLSGARFRNSSRSLKKLTLATIFRGL